MLCTVAVDKVVDMGRGGTHLCLGEVESEREVQALAHGQVARALELVLERDQLLVRERGARAASLQGGRRGRGTRATRALAPASVFLSRASACAGASCFAARCRWVRVRFVRVAIADRLAQLVLVGVARVVVLVVVVVVLISDSRALGIGLIRRVPPLSRRAARVTAACRASCIATFRHFWITIQSNTVELLCAECVNKIISTTDECLTYFSGVPFSGWELYEELELEFESESSADSGSPQPAERMSEMLKDARFRCGLSIDAELEVVGLDCGVCSVVVVAAVVVGIRGGETGSIVAIMKILSGS